MATPTLEDAIVAMAHIKAMKEVLAEAEANVKGFTADTLRALEKDLGAAGANFRGVGKATMTSPTEGFEVDDHDDLMEALIESQVTEGWRPRDHINSAQLQRAYDNDLIPGEVRNWLTENVVGTQVQIDPDLHDDILAWPRSGGQPVTPAGIKLPVRITTKSTSYPRITPDKKLVQAARAQARIGGVTPKVLMLSDSDAIDVEEVGK